MYVLTRYLLRALFLSLFKWSSLRCKRWAAVSGVVAATRSPTHSALGCANLWRWCECFGGNLITRAPPSCPSRRKSYHLAANFSALNSNCLAAPGVAFTGLMEAWRDLVLAAKFGVALHTKTVAVTTRCGNFVLGKREKNICKTKDDFSDNN